MNNNHSFGFVVDLKNHPYFDGVDWQQVAERKSDPPFEPNDIQEDQGSEQDVVKLFELGVVTLGATVVEQFRRELRTAYN